MLMLTIEIFNSNKYRCKNMMKKEEVVFHLVAL